jgi:NAD(P)-dependent dehydrogenase (short-subunit alcohol dehydrogenase family)
VHVLVNNAWSGPPMSRVEWTEEGAMRQAFEVGTLGCLWAMQACFPHMRSQGWGRVVNLCSLNGVNAHMYTVHYNMAKEALRAITRTAAREWADRGITANVLCPAAETEASRAFRARAPAMFEQLDAMLPMGRLGDPEEDIAPVAVFLASEDSRYLTGNTLFADGGSHINGTPWAPELPEEKPG